jgi:hypothetical protein
MAATGDASRLARGECLAPPLCRLSRVSGTERCSGEPSGSVPLPPPPLTAAGVGLADEAESDAAATLPQPSGGDTRRCSTTGEEGPVLLAPLLHRWERSPLNESKISVGGKRKQALRRRLAWLPRAAGCGGTGGQPRGLAGWHGRTPAPKRRN